MFLRALAWLWWLTFIHWALASKMLYIYWILSTLNWFKLTKFDIKYFTGKHQNLLIWGPHPLVYISSMKGLLTTSLPVWHWVAWRTGIFRPSVCSVTIATHVNQVFICNHHVWIDYMYIYSDESGPARTFPGRAGWGTICFHSPTSTWQTGRLLLPSNKYL